MVTAQKIALGFAAAGVAWPVWFEYLRHRSWLKYRHLPLTPGTQGLAFIGAVGGLILMLIAVVILLVNHYAS
jgi:hypothetical protein